MLRIGMLTSGGDCQALNAAMRGVVKGICSKRDDVEIYGFKDGYKGLIYADFSMLTSKDFSGILTRGGTILGTSRQMCIRDRDSVIGKTKYKRTQDVEKIAEKSSSYSPIKHAINRIKTGRWGEWEDMITEMDGQKPGRPI